jgi:hypothetical protein
MFENGGSQRAPAVGSDHISEDKGESRKWGTEKEDSCMAATTTTDLSELETERRRLALAVEQGERGAKTRLAAIEARMATARGVDVRAGRGGSPRRHLDDDGARLLGVGADGHVVFVDWPSLLDRRAVEAAPAVREMERGPLAAVGPQ